MFPNLRAQWLYVYGIQAPDPFTLENIKKYLEGPPKEVFFLFCFNLCGILKIDIYLTRNENLYDVLGEVGRNGWIRGALSKQVIFKLRLGA